MFEHLDNPFQPLLDEDGAEYAEILRRGQRLRRRHQAVVTVLSLSLVSTGGVCGLALGGPEAVHAPIGTGTLMALGDPRSTEKPVPLLTASEQTSNGACPSLAAFGRPATTAAVAVAVTGAVVVGNVDDPPGTGGSGSSAVGTASTPLSSTPPSASGSGSGSSSTSHRAAATVPSGGGSHVSGPRTGNGGNHVPPSTVPPVTHQPDPGPVNSPPVVTPPESPPIVTPPQSPPPDDPGTSTDDPPDSPPPPPIDLPTVDPSSLDPLLN